MKTLSVKIPETLANWLNGQARETRRSRSALVREALEARRTAHVSVTADGSQKKFASMAEAMDSLGDGFDGPGDLNSNPVYWREFGK